MIRVRDDDVLISSRGHSDPFGRFRGVHNTIMGAKVPGAKDPVLSAPDKFIHVPSILVTEIQEFPACVEYVKSETSEGRMKPELHGLMHIDYGNLTLEAVVDHLERGMEWMERSLDVIPKIWYTPWGSNQPHLYEAANSVGLKLVDCSNIIQPKNVINGLRKYREEAFKTYKDAEVIIHWWEGIGRLRRIVNAFNLGDWTLAG